VLKTVPTMGAGWCPPGILGLGIGGTPEKAMLLAKESLMAPVDIDLLFERQRAGAALTRLRRCGWSCTRRSTRWASAPKGWAG